MIILQSNPELANASLTRQLLGILSPHSEAGIIGGPLDLPSIYVASELQSSCLYNKHFNLRAISPACLHQEHEPEASCYVHASVSPRASLALLGRVKVCSVRLGYLGWAFSPGLFPSTEKCLGLEVIRQDILSQLGESHCHSLT